MKDIKDMKDMETLREKELTKRNKRIQNTISLIRKLNCVIVAIAASLTFFNVWSDYNHYAGSQLVMAEVIDVKGASNENISVTYRYNIAGKEYESNKVQHLKKIKNGDKEEIRVKKDSPEVIFKYNNVIFAIFYDMTLGFCIGLTVVFFRLCEMTNCMLPSDVEEAGTENVGFTTTPGVTFASIMEENKKKNKKINSEKKI